MNPTAIALNRFGLGARPDDSPLERPQAWLLDQFERYAALPPAWAAQPRSRPQLSAYLSLQRDIREAPEKAKGAARARLRRHSRSSYDSAVGARTAAALDTPAPFVERLVHFWSNHFAVSIEKVAVLSLAGAFEADAIRPHVLGRFEDMLLAATRHPAMQFFLDQFNSIGPGSPLALRAAQRNPRRPPGLNENLAREILELHTLGVRSGYTQSDVTELARALTGWSVGGPTPAAAMAGDTMAAAAAPAGRSFLDALAALLGGSGPAAQTQMADGVAALHAAPDLGYRFRDAVHEPGARTLLGRVYAQAGEAQAVAILKDLAAAPATARHLATKLARHFVADEPPQAVVDRLTDAYLRSGGELPAVYRALVESPEVWQARGGEKFKTPWEWAVSALRGLDQREISGERMTVLMAQLGQPVWRPGSPAGYDDIGARWAAPDALLRRVETAQRVVAETGDMLDPRVLAARLMPGAVSDDTVRAIGRAESASTGLALLLVAPEFLRR